jgi:hypothetical protein
LSRGVNLRKAIEALNAHVKGDNNAIDESTALLLVNTISDLTDAERLYIVEEFRAM